ncbi:hypothetical protein [Phenylobacterium sp.]|jgi:hypothetical protein|uniref:hypothetical protein n=1 Tax=Phenylobacterium sp. TaxID=1871053 RepID=UPI002F95A561
MRRREGQPVLIQADASLALQRVDLGGTAASGYDEQWLQSLLHRHPEVLPISQIEPDFGRLIPACRELPLDFGGTKYLDNLFVTEEGRLAIVEAKLWRNPEARRKVIAQVMEYASAIFELGYEGLDRAVQQARKAAGEPEASLFQVVSRDADQALDEAEFIDAVAQNLRRGRALVLVVGDGIREDILPLANLLQGHAGFRFTFSLVELAIYSRPLGNEKVVVPSVLAQTTLIERGVVKIEEGNSPYSISVHSPAIGAAPQRGVSLGVDEFFEQLGKKDAAQAGHLKAFLARAEAIGFYPDRLGGLNLKHASPDGKPLNVATIGKTGMVDTGPSGWFRRTGPGATYNRTLADLIGGQLKQSNGSEHWELRTADGKMPRLHQLLPHHSEAWLGAMDRYVADVSATLEATSEKGEAAV